MNLLGFLSRWKRLMFMSLWGFGIAMVFLVFVGGYFFDLSGALVFSWFLVSLIIMFAFFVIVAVILFVIWLFAERPVVAVMCLLAAGALFVAVLLFITPESNPIRDLGEILAPKFDFLNKK